MSYSKADANPGKAFKAKKLSIINSPVVRGRLRRALIKSRRETIYKMLSKKHAGKVPCFVCGKHVDYFDATVEHILERRNGGTDDINNLSISHYECNRNRK